MLMPRQWLILLKRSGRTWFARGGNRIGWQVLRARGSKDCRAGQAQLLFARNRGGTGPARRCIAGERR